MAVEIAVATEISAEDTKYFKIKKALNNEPFLFFLIVRWA